jgi:hypothetical protein
VTVLRPPRRRHLIEHDLPWSPLNAPLPILDRQRGLVGPNGRAKVCLYGCGHGSAYAPLDDPTWQVWGLNTVPPLDAAGRIRADLWWDLHARCAQSDQDLAWIRQLPVPIFVPDDLLDLGPHTVRFPLETVLAVAPGPFACTFAYQIAYALLVGVREVGLFGIELAYGDRRERTVEWASVNWWMGYAVAQGMIFHLPPDSRLGQHPHRYGFDYQQEIDDVQDYVAMMRRFDVTEDARRERRASVGG